MSRRAELFLFFCCSSTEQHTPQTISRLLKAAAVPRQDSSMSKDGSHDRATPEAKNRSVVIGRNFNERRVLQSTRRQVPP